MKKFLKFFNYYYYKILGNQNINSEDKKIIFVNSGLSSLKKILFKFNINLVSFQYCLRMNGLFNDIKNIKDGIHSTSFIMLGNFTKKNNHINLKQIFFFLKISKIKKRKIFFTVNINDYLNIINLLIFKINFSQIIFTKKNIWKINKNGYFGFCLEIYIKLKKKLLEVWNIVNILFIKKGRIIKKLKKKIIDTGLGLYRFRYFKKKNNNKINYKLIDILNSIFLIFSYINKKNIFFLNKLLKIILIYSYKNNLKIWYFLFFYFKTKKKKYFNFDLNKFFFFVLKKEFFFLNNLKKKIKIKNIKNIIFLNKTFGLYIYSMYEILKKNYL